MKESYYFPHDYTASRDPKILMLRSEFGLIGYALFFMLLESMAEEENGKISREAIGGLSVAYNIPKEDLIRFIDYCLNIALFYEDDQGIYNKRMIEHKNWRRIQSEYGRKGARKRWNPNTYMDADDSANSLPNSLPNSPPNAKERKGKERKRKENNIPPTAVSVLKDKSSNTDTVKPSKFVPPTLEEVKAFFKQKGYTESAAVRAFEYYNEMGWRDSKNKPVLNWKSKMISVWFKDEHKLNQTNSDLQLITPDFFRRIKNGI